MKMKALLLSGALALCLPATAQVKIGNNPEVIDAASLLELESTDRVLVITRVNTSQMEAISPSLGALVYNTDAGCLYYYDGALWVNICESLPVTFDTRAIVNPAPSIVITQLGDTLNFEVGLNAIRSENIVDFSIRGRDIQDKVIDRSKLTENSVGTDELGDNAVTDSEMNYDLINITNFVYNNASSGLFATNVQAALDELAGSTNSVSLVDYEDGTYDFTDAAGNVTTISDTSISTLVDNNNGTYTYTDETGLQQVINTNGLNITDTVAGNLIATIAQADGSSTAVNESVTTLTTADAVTYTYLSEDGTPTSFIGTDDQSAQEVAYDDTATALGAVTVQEAIVALNTGSTDDQTLSNDPIIPGNISIEDGNTIVINVNDADADITNELTLIGTTTPPPAAGTNDGNTYVDTSTGQLFVWDGTIWIPVGGTNAADNDPNPTNEIQDLDFTANVITLSGDPTPTSIDLSGFDTNAADDFDGQWVSLTGVPAGFLDGIDNDTQLDEAAVDAFVANNGYLTTEIDGSTTNEIQDLDFTLNVITLSGDPTPTSIDLNGFDTNAADDFDGQWGSLLGIPAGFQDGIDNDTQLDEAAVDAFVANNGYLTTEVDDSVTNEIQDLDFTLNVITLSGDPTPTSIDLNGFDTNAADDFDGQWGSLLGIPAGFQDGIDNDTQLDEAAVDAFVSNNGFLSAEVDGDPINEIQVLTIDADQLSLSLGGGAVTVPNITNSDLTLTGDRTQNLAGNNLVFTGVGSVGIGTNANPPASKLDVDGQIQARNGFAASNGSAGQPSYGFYQGTDTNMGMYRIGPDQLGFSTNGVEAIRVTAAGDVGIGNIVPAAKLHVNGNAQIDGNLVVTTINGSTFPDYVFQSYFTGASTLKPDYQMPSLSEVREFVAKYHHLPGVTSAEEVKAQGGIILNHATTQNLEKIEELFLHTLEQEAKIEALQQENAGLSEELEEIKVRMARIEEMLSQKSGE